MPARQNQFIQENNFSNASVRPNAIAMNKISAFIGWFTENPLWFQQFELRQFKILNGGQPIVDFVLADNCRLYVTTMEAMNFQDEAPQFQLIISKYVLVFDLTSMQDANENCHCPELVGEPLTLELGFTFPLEHVIELILLGERKSLLAVDKSGVVGQKI